MPRPHGSALLVAALATGSASAGQDQLPGTLNFKNVTDSRIVADPEPASSNEKEVEYGDFNEDGLLDVVIANAQGDFGTRRNKLYVNSGGTFMEVTSTGAIPGFAVNKVSRNAFFRDFDGDDHLDVYIINDANSNPDQIFLSDWTGGVFNSFVEGFGRIPNGGSTGAACSGWSADFDQDGDYDVYCGNYPNSPQDKLLRNDGSGFFTDTPTWVPNALDYVVDVTGADMNGDGKLDILKTNFGSSPSWIYYNDLNGAGSEIGDMEYAGSTQLVVEQHEDECAFETGDFDNDDDLDIYANNSGEFFSDRWVDRVFRNDGNDEDGKAILEVQIVNLPASVTTVESRKITVADLNNDGRDDVFVMKEAGASSRPTVLRNVTVNGDIEFVDWTPKITFPSSDVHMGWHAAIFDTNNDGDRDIFLGGWQDDHLFENVASIEHTEGELAEGAVMVIPDVSSRDPHAVLGSVGPGNPDEYQIDNLLSGSYLAVVLNGADDYLLEILDTSDVVLATIDRGGLGVEEATQYDPVSMPSSVKVRVSALACASPFDIAGDCGVGIEDFLDLLAAWGPNPGHPADYDNDDVVGINDFLELLANWGESNYILEVLARDG